MKVKFLFRAVKELTFSTGNGIKMTAGRAQCDNKMTILSENRNFVLNEQHVRHPFHASFGSMKQKQH